MKAIASTITFCLLILSIGCRSNFEQIRTSGDPTKMYEKANAYFEEGEYSKAISLYELIIPSFRGKAEAEQIAFQFAKANYLRGSFTSSSHYFRSFAETFRASPNREEAMFLSAYSNYKLSPRHKLDQAATQKAIDDFQIFVNTFPNSERISECNQYIDQLRVKLEEKAFDSGKLYFQTRNYSSAIQTLENMLKDFPDSSRSEEARYLIVKASLDWADNSIFTRQEERYKKTVERCTSYIKRHGNSERSEEVISYKDKCEKQINSFQNG